MPVTRPLIAALVAVASLSTVAATAPSARADPGDITYYLRPGSTNQEGCFGLCACPLQFPKPLRGTFVLTPALPDPTFQVFSVSNVHWRAPALNETFTGGGEYRFTSGNPGLERMDLDLAINGDAPLHWSSLRRVSPTSLGVISTAVTLSSECYNIAITLRATPFRSDWNADGAIAIDDLFEFLTSWFAADGDSNQDTLTTPADIFDFIDAWMSRA